MRLPWSARSGLAFAVTSQSACKDRMIRSSALAHPWPALPPPSFGVLVDREGDEMPRPAVLHEDHDPTVRLGIPVLFVEKLPRLLADAVSVTGIRVSVDPMLHQVELDDRPVFPMEPVRAANLVLDLEGGLDQVL